LRLYPPILLHGSTKLLPFSLRYIQSRLIISRFSFFNLICIHTCWMTRYCPLRSFISELIPRKGIGFIIQDNFFLALLLFVFLGCLWFSFGHFFIFPLFKLNITLLFLKRLFKFVLRLFLVLQVELFLLLFLVLTFIRHFLF